MAEEETKTTRNASSGGGRGLWTVVPLVILAALGIWFWANRGGEAATDSTRVRSTLHLDTFVLNLADSDQRSYLRVGIDLGLNHEPRRDEVLPVAQARDAILGVLSEVKAGDLATADDRKKLKDNLLHALEEKVPQLGVVAVYFTEFLIQR